jgi:hypothetical protein
MGTLGHVVIQPNAAHTGPLRLVTDLDLLLAHTIASVRLNQRTIVFEPPASLDQCARCQEAYAEARRVIDEAGGLRAWGRGLEGVSHCPPWLGVAPTSTPILAEPRAQAPEAGVTTDMIHARGGCIMTLEALWTVDFGAVGGGVIVLKSGQIFGGDGARYYLGTFTAKGTKLGGQLSIAWYSGPRKTVWGDEAKVVETRVIGEVAPTRSRGIWSAQGTQRFPST